MPPLTISTAGPTRRRAALRDVATRARSATVLVAARAGHVVGSVTVANRGGKWAAQAAPDEANTRMPAVHGAGPQRRG